MDAVMNRQERERSLVHLIHQEYIKDRKEEQLYNRFYRWLKKIMGQKEVLPGVDANGYVEDETSIRIYEKLKAKEISIVDNKNLIIATNGVVNASVKANTLYVAGTVNGNVMAKYVFIKGRVVGDINAEYLEIFPRGYTEGNVETSNLYIHKKASLNGDCHIH